MQASGDLAFRGDLRLRVARGPRTAPTERAPLTPALFRQRARVALAGLRIALAGIVAGRGALLVHSELRLRKFDHRRGVWIDYGVVSRKVVTDAGVSFLCSDWFDASTDITNFNSHGYGTGVAAEAVTDTTLGTEQETPRGAGTKSKPAANQLQTVQTHTFAGTFAITEHGIFSAATAGTLWDRSVFAAVNVVSGDSITITYTLTVTSGG